MNLVEPGSFLTLHYRVSGPEGDAVVDTFGGGPATLSLGAGELSPTMEECLIGLEAGRRASFELPPGRAFGQRSLELVRRIPRSTLDGVIDGDEDYVVGDVVRFPTPDGQATFAGIVRQVEDDALTFDFNHPLAGRAVTLDVEIIGILPGAGAT